MRNECLELCNPEFCYVPGFCRKKLPTLNQINKCNVFVYHSCTVYMQEERPQQLELFLRLL
jgi:hypothetical protein